MSVQCVYRIFSEAGEALYVGTSSRPWWVRVAEQATAHPEIANTAGRVEVTYHASRESAFEVEKAEIERLAPRINTRSLWAESRDHHGGELIDLVLETITELGEAMTSTIADRLGGKAKRSSIATTVMRLRQTGRVEVLRWDNSRPGRPQSVVRVVTQSAQRTAA